MSKLEKFILKAAPKAREIRITTESGACYTITDVRELDKKHIIATYIDYVRKDVNGLQIIIEVSAIKEWELIF